MPASDADLHQKQEFLLRTAEALHAYGTPAHRLEGVMQKLAASLGVEASFLSTVTSVGVTFGRGPTPSTRILRVDSGEVNLGKLVEFDEVMEDVEAGRLTLEEALRRVSALASAPRRYGLGWAVAAWGVASGGAACILGGAPADALLSFVLGASLAILGRAFDRRQGAVGLFEPVAAFLVAAVALVVAARAVAVNDRLVTLSSLIVLLPGLTLTTALTELTTRHLVSGVARLAGAGSIYLTLLFGAALAWRALGGVTPGPPLLTLPESFPGWFFWVVAAAAPFAFAVLLQARVREFWIIFAAAAAGFLVASWASGALGPDLGSFLGALTVGVVSNLYARFLDRPALVPMTPGIFMLVPGSLGFRSLAAFTAHDATGGVDLAVQTSLVAVSLVGGLLIAGLLVPARRVL